MHKRHFLFLKKAATYLTIIATFFTMSGIGSLMPLVANATDPAPPQFWIQFPNGIYPNGGNVATSSFAGFINFSGAVNPSTAAYSSTNASSSSILLLQGNFFEGRYFMPDSPDAIQLSSYDVEQLVVSTTNAATGKINFTVPNNILQPATTYTILARGVCASGHVQGEWEYCTMGFQTFTTVGATTYGASINMAPNASTLCGSSGISLFPIDTNRGLYSFNAFGSGTLNSIKLYSNVQPSSIVSQVKIYQDKTSSTNPNGNWTLEPGIDPLLAMGSAWTDEGGGVFSITIDIAPDMSLPSTNPNGSLGFIAIDMNTSATAGTTFSPKVQANSFTFGGTDAAALTTMMNNSITALNCPNPLVTVISSTNQSQPYIQNIVSMASMGPMQQNGVLAIDYWSTPTSTIQTIEVQVIVPSSSGFNPEYGLNTLAANSADSGVNIYRDNKTTGTVGSFDGQDTRLALSSAPVWSSTNMTGNSRKATLSLATPITAPSNNTGSNAGPDYFIVVKTSSNPAPGASFQVKIPYSGFLTGFPANNDAISNIINIQAGGGMMMQNLVISELKTAGTAAADEFIELYNPTNAAIDLSSYSIQYRGGASGVFNKKNFTTGQMIPAYGFFLVANADGAHAGAANLTYLDSAISLSATGGTVFLVATTTTLTTGNETTIRDKVAWGTGTLFAEGEAAPAPAANKSIERKAWYQATAASMAANGMDANMGNMEDTYNNLMDFVTQDTPVPQNTSSIVENPTQNMQGGEGSPVVINEVYYQPTSGSGWIELLNRSASSQTLTNWTLTISSHSISSSNRTYTFPTFTLGANEYVLVWWYKAGTNTARELYTGTGGTVQVAMATFAGDITLKDNTANMKDYVQYGGINQPGEETAVTAKQWVDDHTVPSVLQGQSIGRKGNYGDDMNRMDDWQTYTTPSPGTGASNGDSFPPEKVTTVVLADNDDCQPGHTCNYGLNGQDVTITWTPNATPDTTFEKYLIYLLPASVSLNITAQIPFAETYSGQNTNSFTGMMGMSKDSQNPGVTLATGSYRAYVVAQDHSGNRSSAVSSAAVNLTADTAVESVGADANKPFIMHMSVWQAKAGANIVLMARFVDDRTLGSVPGAGAQVVWQAANSASLVNMVSGTATTTTNCVAINANYHSCTIPSVNAVEGKVVAYYLKSQDAAGNATFMSASPQADMGSYANVGAYQYAVSQHPFIIDILAASNYTDDDSGADLSGTIYQPNGSALQDAYIFMEGSASGWATTTASGVFSIADNTMMPGSWPLVMFKDGYMDMSVNAFRGDSTLNFYLNQGGMNVGGATVSGYMAMPSIIYSQPTDGMMGVPIENFTMRLGFSKAMNANTIIDNDASNAGSNIYLTTNGMDRATGTAIIYNSTSREATLTKTGNLNPDTHYILVITSAVTDEMGNPISGGWRADGAYEVGFNTMMNNNTLWGTGWKDAMSGGGAVVGGSAGYFGGMNLDNYATGGQMMPPYVKGTFPAPGSFNINRNSSFIIEFSEAMDAASIEVNTIKLFKIANQTMWSVGDIIPAAVTLDATTQRIVTLNPTSNLDLNTANGGWYVLRVTGKVKSAKGIWLGNPQNCGTQNPDTCLASQTSYEASFQLNSSSSGDTARPSVLGTFPNNNDGITAGTPAVDVGIPAIDIGFSEAMDPSTMNTQNITLQAGSKSITGKIKYDPMSNSAKFVPASALQANTQYTLTIATTTTDLAGLNLDQDAVAVGYQSHTIYFKTGGADTVSPTVVFANGDDYSLAITYSEPMIAAKQTDTNLWAYSVLNPANYYLNGFTVNAGQDPGSWSAAITLRAPYNTSGGTQLSTITGLNFEYDEPTNTVTIKGLTFNSSEPHATDLQVFVDNVRDKSNNVITDTTNRAGSATHRNAGRGPIQSSSGTYGMLGPGGGGMMMMGTTGGGGGPVTTVSGTASGPGMNMGQMGMMKAGAFPMNAMAGQTSLYFIDIPITKQIKSGGKVVLTFPAGFNVANAQQDLYSPMNKDFNNWATGVMTFACSDTAKNCSGSTVSGDASGDTSTKGGAADDGITINSSSRIVNIHFNGNDTLANDFLHIDVKGIANASIPKEFGTDGYTVDIKTMSPDGTLLESITTMPFFINQGGSDSLNVVVNCGNVSQNSGTMTVFLGSPMTGPMEAVSTTFTNGIATSTFSNLAAGQYMLFTDPFITIGSNNYYGKTMPEPVTVSGATTKTMTIEQEGASGTTVYVTIKGNLSTNSVNDQIDIFANSPSGFRVKTITPMTDDGGSLDGDGTDNNGTASTVAQKTATSVKYSFKLPNGQWMVGMSPSMPKGPMAGPAKMPDWMPPMSIDVNINGATVTENNGTANDGIVTFDLSNQSVKTIGGKVTDGVATQTYPQGTPIADAEVYAYQPNGGFGGANTRTATDGTFTLKIPVIGLYKIGTFKPGLPNAQEMMVDVRDAGNYDSTGTAITAVNGANPLILKIKKPAYTISGKVLNRSSKAVSYAPVWAWQSNGTGHADTMTDEAGNYILYVDNGTWRVEADAPGVGWLQYEMPITINNASQSNINLKPATNLNWYDISGTISIDGAVQTYMPIRAVEYSATGAYLGKEFGAMTDSNGAYTLTVPGTGTADTYKYYRVDIWTPTYGEIGLSYDDVANSPANIKISNAATSTANILIASANLKTVTVVFANKSGYVGREAFINIDGANFLMNVAKQSGFHKSLRVVDISGANPTIKLAPGDYFFFTDVPGTGKYIPLDTSPAFDANKKCITIDGTGDTVNFSLPDLTSADAVITISGAISGPAVGNKDGWVWVGNPDTGFHTGTNAASSTGAYSLTVPKLSSGKYKVGAERPGYTSPEAVSNNGTANAIINFTLTAASYSISGKIYHDISGGTTNSYDAGEAVANGFVRAEEVSTGAKTHAPVDATGSYSLAVNNGTWKIFGRADGYTDSPYTVADVPTQITVSSASQTGKNVELNTDADWSTKTKSKPITPANGGTIDDTAQNTSTGHTDGTGVKMIIPANALGSDSSTGNVTTVETSAVTQTDSMKPFDDKGKVVTATDNSGQAITNLNDYVNMEMVLYKADIASSTDIVDEAKLKTMKMGYWDDSKNEWVNLPTTQSAYYKTAGDPEWKTYNGTATTTGYAKFIDDSIGTSSPTFVAGTDYTDYKLVFTAATNHFTVFALGTSPDLVAPAAPTGLAQTSGTGSAVALSWSRVTTNSDNSAITDLYGYAVYRSTNGTAYSQVSTSRIAPGAETYTDTNVSPWTSYYYKVTAGDDDDQESAYSAAVRVCSNKTVCNGTVATDCTITCNSGYTLNSSNHTCDVQSSGGAVITQPTTTTAKTTTTTETPKTTTETTTQPQTITEKIISRVEKIVQIVAEAKTEIISQISSLLETLGITRNEKQEKSASKTLVAPLLYKADVITEEIQKATTNFITYGTPTTKALGQGERAGVLHSFLKAFNRLPKDDTDWQDTIKIANSRFPKQQSIDKEKEALKIFGKIYLRMPDFSNSRDEAVIKIVAYGIRPVLRNLNSEKAAIKTFKHIFGANPATTQDWDIMRAIAYSGAKR